jgi:hypothetical protein
VLPGFDTKPLRRESLSLFRRTLRSTAVGEAVLQAITAAVARAALGVGALGDQLFTAAAALDGRRLLEVEPALKPIAASVAANALTVTINPALLNFRSSAVTTGASNPRTIASATSLVVPNGATLGTVNGVQARLAILAIDNAGAVEAAIVNLAGGVSLDESGVISTTAISAAASSASVIYSTSARASVPYRVVGFIDITQATAGAWATGPSLVQGAGGAAIAAMQALGYGQTLQNLSGSRNLVTTYTNTTPRPIWVEVKVSIAAGGSFSLQKNGSSVQIVGNNTPVTTDYTVATLVLPGQTYAVTASGGPAYTWYETR